MVKLSLLSDKPELKVGRGKMEHSLTVWRVITSFQNVKLKKENFG